MMIEVTAAQMRVILLQYARLAELRGDGTLEEYFLAEEAKVGPGYVLTWDGEREEKCVMSAERERAHLLTRPQDAARDVLNAEDYPGVCAEAWQALTDALGREDAVRHLINAAAVQTGDTAVALCWTGEILAGLECSTPTGRTV